MNTRMHKRLSLLSAPLACLIVSGTPAKAHWPYFTESKAVTLPDGSPGEMRILAGDGIVVADPTRLILLDSTGQLLARSRPYGFVDIVCDAPKRCFGYDVASGEILEPDSTTFHAGNILVPPIDHPRDDRLWDIEGDETFFGFAVRPATSSEAMRAEWQRLARAPITMGYGLIVGLCAGLTFAGLSRRKRTRGEAILLFAWRALIFVAFVSLVVFGLAIDLFVAPVPVAVIFLIGAASILPHLLVLASRRLRSRQERAAS